MNLTKLAHASCVMVLSIILSFSTQAQLSANFTATPTSGCAPLLVTFSDQSTGNPNSWKWDLGNGTISQLHNPSVVYSDPGQYTVKLVIRNASGADSVVRTQYIHVYTKPTVVIGASDTAGCAPMVVHFSDLSNPGSGTSASWQWDFGDGNFSTQQNPTHTYTATGSYNVSLMVTNSFGCTQSLTQTHYINITNKPTASFTIGSTANCGAPLNVNFTNQSTGIGTLTYLWFFGDGGTSTQPNPSHTYLTTGTFSVQLVVYNQSGCTDTMVRANAFTIANNVTLFSSPTTVCANSPVSITNSTTPAPVNVSWNFGDGTTSSSFTPTKTYTTPGTYEITMVNNYGICMDSMTRSITVLPQPEADFTASPTSACYAPLNVNFTNNSTGATTYQWSFGDNTTSTQANPMHTYNSQSDYAVTLTATGANGCSIVKTRSNYINIHLPVVAIDSLPKKGCAPLTWTFHHSVLGGDPIASYQWNFGDGTSSTQQSPTHTFDVGHYDIQLIITTVSGCTDTVTYVNGIKAGVRPHVSFSANPTDVCAFTPVVFADSTTPVGAANQWYWDFGDGGTSVSQNPQHTYTDTGYMNIMLIAYNDGCADTLVRNDYVHINPPIANFIIEKNCSERMKRIFHDRSIGADTWLWEFGDGQTSADSSPVHIYTTSGVYNVRLTVHNNTTGCDFTKTASITVVDQHPSIVASDTVICRGSTIAFSAGGATPSLFASFNWNFGDNTSGAGNPINKTYYIPGFYTIKLISSDKNGCRDTVIKPRYITVNGPTANFGSSVTSICSGSIANFTDSSITDGRNGWAYSVWNFGDGQTDTSRTRNVSHIYSIGGSFTVTVTAFDSSGCSNQMSRTNVITVYHPTAAFSTFDTLSCPSRDITFMNNSTGSGITYQWNFGDGTASTDQNPTHRYTRNGAFNVRLIVTDINGCRDTMVRNNYIRIVTPSARFTASDTLGTCPPLIVNFTNNSLNYTSYSWNFGDGTNSSIANPSHFYAISGTFPAQLTITGPGGCTSTKTTNIVVRGPRGNFTYGGLSGCVPKTVNFTANAIGASTYIWDFSDGNTLVTNGPVQTHNYIVAGSFVPKLILKDTAGCTVPLIGTDTIRTYDLNAAFNFNAPAFCDRGNVQFNNTTTSTDVITAYQWSFGDGSTASTPNPSHQYNTSGLYYPQLITQSVHGCADTIRSTQPVRVVASPQPQIEQTANGCVDLTVRFNARLSTPDTSAISWSWSLGNGNTSTLVTPAPQLYTAAGQYPIRLTATNSNGCIGTDTSSVEAYAIPVINAGNDTMVCKGRGTALHATGGATYIWSPATALSCTDCASPIASPADPITYHLIGRSVHGCSNTDSIRVLVKYPFHMVTSPKDSLCLGGSVRMAASGAHSYVWSPTTGLDNSGLSSPTATPVQSTRYMVIGTDDKNCFKDTGYVPIIVHNNPTVEAGEDRTINVGQTVTLRPVLSSDVTSVIWSPTGSIFMSAPPGITVKPNMTTTYTVHVANRGGCTATDQLTVNVLCNGANLFIPNTFSPNHDGMNDLFYPRGTGIFTIKSIKIFSRWGELVFEKANFNANDATKAWDGTYKGRSMNPDVFVYVVDVMCDNNAVLTFKGNVALIK